MMLWPEAMDARTYHASTRARARESKRVRQHFRLHVLGLGRAITRRPVQGELRCMATGRPRARARFKACASGETPPRAHAPLRALQHRALQLLQHVRLAGATCFQGEAAEGGARVSHKHMGLVIWLREL